MVSLLKSRYVIDGVPQELTPAQMLGESGYVSPDVAIEDASDTVVDESCEPGLDAIQFESFDPDYYFDKIRSVSRKMPVAFAGAFTRGRVAGALIDAIWRNGHFKSGDLCLSASWKVNPSAVGNLAAFYRSVEAAADYVNDLGLSFEKYSVAEGRENSVAMKAALAAADNPEDVFLDQPYRTEKPVFGRTMIPSTLEADFQSWLVYVPFDTADYRLGGSMLAQATGQKGGIAPMVQDADYFLDCYEVVRELVEDGIAIAGTTVLDGGLMTAVERMTTAGTGVNIDISDMKKAVGENNIIRLLFAEVPGALIQIRDNDFDYLDAEMLLQDVLFFPLGHPNRNGGKVTVRTSEKTGIQSILESLIRNQGAEGED